MANYNAYNLELEYHHFQSYQHLENETKRMRHDMKNHLLCMNTLMQKNEIDELKLYLLQMTSQVNQLDSGIVSGNSIVDAVCNEKKTIALSHDIVLRFEGTGQIPADMSVAHLDWCTIFANALDNAIEYVTSAAVDRWIQVSINRQKDMLLITFINPVKDGMQLLPQGCTTKEDNKVHGYGIMNMQMAVQKYHGMMKITTEVFEGTSVYCVRILFPQK